MADKGKIRSSLFLQTTGSIIVDDLEGKPSCCAQLEQITVDLLRLSKEAFEKFHSTQKIIEGKEEITYNLDVGDAGYYVTVFSVTTNEKGKARVTFHIVK